MQIINRDINRIFIFDDQSDARDAFASTVQETEMEVITQQERVNDLDGYLRQYLSQNDGIVSDHHLKKANYFPVNGAQVVFESYNRKIPAVLVTRAEQSDINEIRRFRKYIPSILSVQEFNPDALINSLEICVKEFNGDVMLERKGFRALIRVEDADDHNIYVVVPSWDDKELITVNKNQLPMEVSQLLRPDMRIHAEVNLAAETLFDLYFDKWETQ